MKRNRLKYISAYLLLYLMVQMWVVEAIHYIVVPHDYPLEAKAKNSSDTKNAPSSCSVYHFAHLLFNSPNTIEYKAKIVPVNNQIVLVPYRTKFISTIIFNYYLRGPPYGLG